MLKGWQVLFASLAISVSAVNVNALCTGDGCSIMGATMFTYFLCWPIYLAWIVLALFDFSVPSYKFGIILGIIASIWIYDSTVNLGRVDLFWLPISHLLFAITMFTFLKLRKPSRMVNLGSSE